MTPALALRNAFGVVLPLAVGVAIGAVPSALVVTTGALNVSFSDSNDPYRQRAGRMLASSLLVGIAVFIGARSSHDHIVAVALAAVWAFAAGMLVALGTAAADLGTMSLVTLVVFSSASIPAEKALSSGLLALAGGLLQTLLALALWPVRRYDPENRALAELYLELSRVAASPIEASQAPPASEQSIQAQNSIAALGRGHSVQGERYRLLLNQAERMRLSLLTLARLRARMQRNSANSPEIAVLDRCFDLCSTMLHAIGDSLASGQLASSPTGCLQELQTLAERLRESPHKAERPLPAAPNESETRRTSPPEASPSCASPIGERSAFAAAMVLDARFQMDALAGQLRSALDLAASATPAGLVAFERSESRRPWRLRLSGTMATLRANLSLQSAACRHAIRLTVCVAAGDALARGFDLRRAYWLPMTIAIVLKPDFTATFSRGVLRLAGTFTGLVFATALYHLLPPALAPQVALIGILMFVLRWLGPANYGIFVTAVTALVVVMIALAGVAPKEVIAARGLNTAAGGAIALFAYWVWPTWERTQISEAMAQLLDAYRHYFRAVREGYVRLDDSFAQELEQTRVAGRLARSNLEASVDRLMAEPGAPAESVDSLSAMLATSHRLIHAMMALEAGLVRSRPVPARDAFQVFANDVELTLYYLAAGLRGSALTRGGLPDLREDHHALVASGDSLTERHALVNVETDRIANSLNMLSEETLKWIATQRNAKRKR